jgi:hypothetical protein
MTRSTICIAAGLALAAVLPAMPTQAAGVARTFVSAAGSDSNNCANVMTPCRHFAAAYAATATNGEIYVLDPANYGSLTITHAVSIQGHGWGSVAPPAGGAAITINATSTDDVNLDGLTIDGTGLTSTNGIVFNSGKSLTVENCVVRNMAGHGLQFYSTATTTQTLAVSNSYFNDNAGNGIGIEPRSSGAITAAIDRTEFHDNANIGLFVYAVNGTGPVSVAVTDSVAANGDSFNGNTGFDVESSTNHSVSNLSLTHTLAVGNAIGVAAGSSNATLWLAQSTVTGNAQGYSVSNGGVIKTYGDNYLAAGNGSNTGTLTSVGKQ